MKSFHTINKSQFMNVDVTGVLIGPQMFSEFVTLEIVF
jgi:hypothetical protein